IATAGLSREGQPSIADHRIEIGLAVADIGEKPGIARGIDHRLVDLEEFPALARTGGAGQRTGTEPDHSHAKRRSLAFADRRDRPTDAAVLVIVGDRLRATRDPRAVGVLEFLGT